MIFLKIFGAVSLVLLLLLIIILLSSIRVKIASKSGEEIKFALFLGSYKAKSKKQKNSQQKASGESKAKEKNGLSPNLKRMLGIDKFDSIKSLKTNLKETGFDGTFGKTLSIVKFLMKQLGKLVSRVKLKSLKIDYIHAGSDAAQVAVNYGILCAFVYPFATFIKEATNSKDSKFSVNLNCDFDRNEPYYEFYCEVKLKIIYALIVFLKTLSYIAKENVNEEQKDRS